MQYNNISLLDRLIRLSEVCDVAGIRKTAVYERINLGQFPRQVQIGLPDARRGTARWSLIAVQEWVDAQKSGQSWACADSATTTFQSSSMSANTTLKNEVAS